MGRWHIPRCTVGGGCGEYICFDHRPATHGPPYYGCWVHCADCLWEEEERDRQEAEEAEEAEAAAVTVGAGAEDDDWDWGD